MTKKVTIKDAANYDSIVGEYEDAWKYLEHGIVIPMFDRVYIVPRFIESPLFKNVNDVEFETYYDEFTICVGYPIKVPDNEKDVSFLSITPSELLNPELETSFYRLNLFGIQGDSYPFTHLRHSNPLRVREFINVIVTKGMELEVAVFDSVK